MHDILAVGITVATILAATFFSNQSINNLRSDMRTELGNLRTELSGKLDAIQKDMREFYAELARHDIRIGNLEHNK